MSFPLKKFFRYQLHLIYTAMGLLSYLFVFSVLKDLSRILFEFDISPLIVIALAVTSTVIGFVNAISGPRIKRVTVPIENLPDELVGFKIAQISDLHIGATIRQSYVEKVVNKVNALSSDVIVLTGDIGDGHVEHFRLDIAPLRFLKSKHGSFFTPGNHEYYWNVNEWLNVMNNSGIINLVNRGKIILHKNKHVLIGGIPDPVSRQSPDLLGIQNSENGETADVKILLSHRPGIYKEASKAGFHLQLSGHTHGGQFFPWTLAVKLVHKISQGLHLVNGMWIYVSPGTGSWGPLIRLGTSPEITLLTLNKPLKKLNA